MNLNRFVFIPALIIAFYSSVAWADEAREDRHDRELNEVKISKKINAENIAVNQAAIAELQAAGVGTQGPVGATGAQGPIGLTGPSGIDGVQGLAGINCWDTNGNRVNDLAEDINGDSSFDVLDCTGTDLTDALNRLSIIEQSISNQDFDGDGFTPASGDCNDGDSAIYLGATEFGIVDNNCNGVIDNASTTADYDSDGLTDWEEVNTYFTDPANSDTDGDSLPVVMHTEAYICGATTNCTIDWLGIEHCGPSSPKYCSRWVPLHVAVDMSDGREVTVYFTNPTLADTDGDGVNDGLEIRNGTDPLVP